jgi:hypothetical protein
MEVRNLGLTSMVLEKETLPFLLNRSYGEMDALRRRVFEKDPSLKSS